MPALHWTIIIALWSLRATLTAPVGNTSARGTFGETSEIIQFLKDGEKAIRISQVKDVVLVLGRTGSGKSTLSQFITGNDEHLVAVEQGTDTGEYIIRDYGNKVCTATTESCTTVPDLIIDKKTQTPFYDCPGFGDTRHVKHDLSVTYFIKKVVESADSVKLIFTTSFPSVRRGVDRQNFMLLVKSALRVVKDVDKFKDSIALIVTKVDNQFTVRKGRATMVSDKSIIYNIASFLEEIRDNLMAKISQKSSPDPYFDETAVKFINVLLIKKGEDYPRIGIFRRPDDAGKLETPMMVENRKSLENIVHLNLNFTQCNSDDFGYTVSAESINRMYDMVEEVNKKIASDVETIAKEIEEGFLLQERDVSDVGNLYKKFHFGYESMRNISIGESDDPRDFLEKIRQTASALNIDVSMKSVVSILHYDRFLKFIRTLSGMPNSKPLEWAEGLTGSVQSFDDSQKWYHFLINLQTTLLKHDVQKHLSKNSTVMDGLRNQIQTFGTDDSLVKVMLEQFLAQVYNDDSEKEYNSIKNARLNSWKLKFLKDMLDFQVLALCQDNKLVVIGNYVHMSDVAGKRCDDVNFVEIFALSKLFIDADFDKTGSKIQLSILAPTWEVIGSPKIILDGKPGREHIESKARDGAWSGADGHDGLPGLPGGAAGNFLGFGWNCINCQFLTVSANGGRGGKGQDGGNGVDGKRGERPAKANHYKNIFNIGLVTVSHEDKGNTGQEGGDGGMGGVGGKGGHRGKVMVVLFDTPEAYVPKISEENGDFGIPGKGGNGGSGGESEHIVESNTYLFGLKAWSNGLVSHLFYFSRSGSSSYYLNDEGIVYPEPRVDLKNPSYAVNHYKAYLRENLDSSLSRLSLEEFLEQLETSKAVRDLYDTLGLVHDLKCLENQYTKLRHRVPLLPFYKALLDKINMYSRDPSYYEISGQYRKVRAFLYLSTLSKVCTIGNNLNNDLVINVKDFFSLIVQDVEQLLKDFMVAKQRNEQRVVYKKEMSGKIAEAHNFIKEDITQESRNILAELDEHIRALVLETQHLQNINRKELKKLNEHMISRAISSVIRIASRALDFFGIIGLATEGIIESTNLISESLDLDGDGSPIGNILGTLPKTVEDFFSLITDHVGEKIKLFVTQLFDVDKIFRDFTGGAVLNETRSFISVAREEFSEFEVSENPEEDLVKVHKKRSELIDYLQDQRKAVEKILQGDPNLDKALDALNDSEQILKLPEGVYNMLKKSKVEELRSGELDANEKLRQLEEYERKIYFVIVPLCKKLNDQFKDLDAFGGQSQAALDVGKWKVQNALSDVNTEILAMTEGFQVQGAMANNIEKLKFGISTMIQVYDRIQDYHYQAALADYMAEVASSKAKAIRITDRTLSDAVDDLHVILKTNLILADYERAINAFGQHVFPFAKAYMEEYDLPTSLKVENSTDDLLSDAIYRINSIERKFLKNDLTISKSLDDYFFPEIPFTSRSQYGPFYLWKYETSALEISKLLRGEEVTLHADITKGLTHNAVKFNKIGIRFRFSNNASQVDFDEMMEKFSIDMNHFGISYYRCDNKFYVMKHDSQKISHSVNENDVGRYSHYNGVYEKISKNQPLLSPYTMWKVKLRNTSGGFEVLSNFTHEIVDMALEGHGSFVSRDNDGVCSDHLDRYYKVDDTIREVPSVDYRFDQPGEVLEVFSRRRRSAVNLTFSDLEEDFQQENGGFGIASPLKRFVQWFTGGDTTVNNVRIYGHPSTAGRDEQSRANSNTVGNSPSESKPNQFVDGHFGGFLDSNGPETAYEPVIGPTTDNTDGSPSGITGIYGSSSQLIKNSMPASHVNIILRNFLMNRKTGVSNIAYRAYGPENNDEIIIVQ